MEIFNVHVLGCGSAKPTKHRKPSCQVVDVHSKLFMIDCGEAAQMEFARKRLAMNRLGHIFISHNHGDHVFGIPGMISTMALLGRTADLHIHAPQEIEPFLSTVLHTYCEGMDYNVLFHPVPTDTHTLVYEDRSVEVWSIPLEHRIPCCGYRFCEKPRPPHIRREMLDAFQIPLSQIGNIKAGASWTTSDGTLIPHDRLTFPADPPRSYSYCSDTAYKPDIIPFIQGSDLLYHEATYPQCYAHLAGQRGHSTARQAAQIAHMADVKALIVGHFSARIENEQELLSEMMDIFPNSMLASDGMTIKV